MRENDAAGVNGQRNCKQLPGAGQGQIMPAFGQNRFIQKMAVVIKVKRMQPFVRCAGKLPFQVICQHLPDGVRAGKAGRLN